MRYFVGLDWGSAEHAACAVDETGHVVWSRRVAHSADGLRDLLAGLARLGPPSELSVALERPSGVLVDTLSEAGHPVVPIHPNVVKASRPRYRAVPAKSDPGDAYLLADLLRTDGHRFRALRPVSDEIRALRALVRARSALVEERVALGNQLRSLLDSFWPGSATLFADIDANITLAFLERYPTPSSSRGLGPKRLAAFLDRNSYSGRRSPEQLLEHLHQAPAVTLGEAEEEAKGALVLSLVRVLLTLSKEIKRVSTTIVRAVAAQPAGRVLMSFPRAGRINAAQILAELGEDPLRFVDEDHLAAEAGASPVTYQSGKHRAVGFRHACNKRLRWAITTFADNSRHASAWASQIYARARARGCDHAHAIRILTRAWIRVLWRCWSQATPYDPTRHRAANLGSNPQTAPG